MICKETLWWCSRVAVWALFFCSLFFGFTVPQTHADDTIVVTGRVGGVVSGPTSSSDDDDDDDDGGSTKKKKTTTSQTVSNIPSAPTVSLSFLNADGSTVSSVFYSPTGATLPQFVTAKPNFSGTTTIANADVTLLFQFSGFSYQVHLTADEAGNFSWQSPDSFPAGYITVQVTAASTKDSSIKATLEEHFLVLSEQTLPTWQQGKLSVIPVEVFLSIAPEDKVVRPGEEVLVTITLFPQTPQDRPVEVPIEYRIVDTDGTELMRTDETLTVDGISKYKKLFYTQADLSRGEYQIIARVASHNFVSTSNDTFVVAGTRYLMLGSGGAYVNYTNPLFLVIALGALFWVALYIEYVRYLRLRPQLHRVSERSFWSFIS